MSSAAVFLVLIACTAVLTAGPRIGFSEKGSQSLPPLAPRPQFRSGIHLVEVDVSAVDDRGGPVTDLRQDELEVFEDGRTRPIVSFTRVALPLPRPRPPVYRDVATNAGADRSRIIFLLLDDANSQREASVRVRAVAKELLARLAPEDRVGMLFVRLGNQGAFEFTTDHAGLAAAVDAFAGEIVNRRSLLPENPSDFMSRPGPGEAGDTVGGQFLNPGNLQTEFDRLRPFGIVTDVSDYLASLPHRRKAFVYIGEGLSAQGSKDPLVENDWDDRRRVGMLRAITAARRANVAVYLLDSRRPFLDTAEDLVETDRPRDLQHLRSGDLSALAEVTGGFSGPSAALVNQIDRIFADTSAYYLLGYETELPPVRRLGGRLRRMVDPWEGFRQIEVRTSRPGVRLRARRGYWPEAEAERIASTSRSASSPTDPASEALRGLVPQPALALASFAAPFRGRGGTPVIAVVLQVQDASFSAAAANGLDETIDVSLVAAEPGKTVHATDRFTARMRLGSDKVAALAAGRYLVCATLPVSPRRYQLRMGVRSAVAGTTGSVYQDVVVPNFQRLALSMSGVVLGLGTARTATPVARAQTLAPFMPFVPTLSRVFTSGDQVRVFVRVYRRGRASAVLSAAVNAISSDDPIWTTTSPVPFTRENEAGVTTELPVSAWTPGDYRLTMTLADQRGEVVDQRRVDFEIVTVKARYPAAATGRTGTAR